MTATMNPLPSNRVGILREPAPCTRCNTMMPKDTQYGWAPTTKGKFHANPVECLAPANAPDLPPARPMQPPATTTQPDATAALSGLAALIAPYLDALGTVTEEQVREIVQAILDGELPAIVANLRKEFQHTTTVTLHDPKTQETKDLGIQHKEFPILLDMMQTRRRRDGRLLNIWLSGPTGSGKTTAVENAAKALGRRFAFCGAMDTSYQLMGYIDANGNVVKTEFRDFVLNGGVFLGDEIDSWSPSAQLALNAVITNGKAAFPDGTFDVSPEFQFVGAANTWGLGATTDYVGRAKLDAAFLARFIQRIDWYYDEEMEIALSGREDWARRIQSIRGAAKRQGLKIIIHPRYTYEGVPLLDIGWPMDKVEKYTVAMGIKPEQWEAIRNG